MNRDEARFLLSAIRPDEADHGDPRIAEALASLADDPELRDWFENSVRFDRTISDRLAEVEPPDGLRDSILAGMDASRVPKVYRRKRWIAAVAAVLAGFLSGLILLPEGDPSRPAGPIAVVAEFEQAMEGVISEMRDLDVHSADPRELLRWLQEREGAVAVPTLVEGGSSPRPGFVGCKIVEWRGREVSLLCMKQPGHRGDMPSLHLFTIDADAIAGLDPEEMIAHLPDADPKTARQQWSTAVWQSGERVYLVLAAGRHANPRELVPFG